MSTSCSALLAQTSTRPVVALLVVLTKRVLQRLPTHSRIGDLCSPVVDAVSRWCSVGGDARQLHDHLGAALDIEDAAGNEEEMEAAAIVRATVAHCYWCACGLERLSGTLEKGLPVIDASDALVDVVCELTVNAQACTSDWVHRACLAIAHRYPVDPRSPYGPLVDVAFLDGWLGVNA